MNNIMIICTIVATVAFVIAVIFLAVALIQVKRTATQAEKLLGGLNKDISEVGKIASNFMSLSQGLLSPSAKIGSWLMGALYALITKNKKKINTYPQEEKK